MRDFAPEALGEQQVAALLPIWKNHVAVAAKVKKYPKGVGLLLEWVRAGVEYKLKKDVLNGLKQKLSEIERQKNEAALAIETAHNTLQELEKRIESYKADLVYAAKLSAVLATVTESRKKRRSSRQNSCRSTRCPSSTPLSPPIRTSRGTRLC